MFLRNRVSVELLCNSTRYRDTALNLVLILFHFFFLSDCPNCVEDSSAPTRWTMPLLKLGEKRYYLSIFFKVSNPRLESCSYRRSYGKGRNCTTRHWTFYATVITSRFWFFVSFTRLTGSKHCSTADTTECSSLASSPRRRTIAWRNTSRTMVMYCGKFKNRSVERGTGSGM